MALVFNPATGFGSLSVTASVNPRGLPTTAYLQFGPTAAYGNITLDENRSAISDNYVQQIVPDTNGDGTPDAKTIRVIPDTDQQFGGLFSSEAPAPDRENPKCVKGSPPEWVGNAEAVG